MLSLSQPSELRSKTPPLFFLTVSTKTPILDLTNIIQSCAHPEPIIIWKQGLCRVGKPRLGVAGQEEDERCTPQLPHLGLRHSFPQLLGVAAADASASRALGTALSWEPSLPASALIQIDVGCIRPEPSSLASSWNNTERRSQLHSSLLWSSEAFKATTSQVSSSLCPIPTP